MKTLLLFLTLTLSLFADAYEGLHYLDSYDKALVQAKKESKLVLLLVVSNECKWCKKLASDALVDPEVTALIKKDFVPVIVNRDNPKSFPALFHTPRVPTIFYLDNEGKDLWETIGYKNSAGIVEDIKESLSTYKEEMTEE